ncbi:MAG: hypothetical protein ACREHD_28965, partial [Pirellulales bacterium]
ALQVSGGTVSLTSATLVSNTAQGGTGGRGAGGSLYIAPGGGAGGNGFGGALEVSAGSAAVGNDSLTSNIAQGGKPGGYFAAVGNGFGGAVQVAAGGAITFSNDAVSSNVAQGGEFVSAFGQILARGLGEGGGVYIASVATVYVDAFTLKNVKNNTASTNSPNVYGQFLET